MVLHVSTFKMSSSGSHCVLLKLRTDLARHNEIPENDILNVETCRSVLFVIIVFDVIVQSLVKL